MKTGLRRGEALALHWSDIDLQAKLLRVRGTRARVSGELVVTETKTPRSRRVVPLSPTVERLLRDIRANQRAERLRAGSMWQPTPYVFTTELGEPCDPRNALRALKTAAKRAGLPSSVGLHNRVSSGTACGTPRSDGWLTPGLTLIRLSDARLPRNLWTDVPVDVTLRHSAASVMLSAGVPLKVVSEVFGHASVAITGPRRPRIVPCNKCPIGSDAVAGSVDADAPRPRPGC